MVMTWQDYMDYKGELEARDRFTLLTPEDEEQFEILSRPPRSFSLARAAEHPFMWAYHVCRFRPRNYQYKMLDSMMRHPRLAGVTSRQIGKSSMVGVLAFWALFNNKYPMGLQKKTRIGIISRDEKAAKKLLMEIRNFIRMADETMWLYTRDQPYASKTYFTDRITTSTQFKIETAQGFIEIFAPTDSVRGNTFSVLIIDEAAWLNCTTMEPDDFYSSTAVPTVMAAGAKGKIILLSTPKGTNGFFHDIIQPENDAPLHGWQRLWMPWTVLPNDSEQLHQIIEEKYRYEQAGRGKDFAIEYEADFRSGKFTFFDHQTLDASVVPYLAHQPQYFNSPITVGLDYGDVHSRTTVVGVAHNPKTDKVELIFHKELPQGFNNADIVKVMKEIKSRYSIKVIVYDDCVGGRTATELLKRAGFIMRPFSFSKQKMETYEYLKHAFATGKIKLYNDAVLMTQLKSLEAHETEFGNTIIKKPKGGRDDLADALLMACSPFIQPKQRGRWGFANFASPGVKYYG